jgi:thymidylate synthase
MEKAYLDAMRNIMENGVDRGDRTGTGTRAIFGIQLRFNMQDGFPAVTTTLVPRRFER